jgi:dimethylargininase
MMDGLRVKGFGGQTVTGRLQRVIVRRPDRAFAEADPVDWNYVAPPDLTAAQNEHDAFVSILRQEGVEVIHSEEVADGLADAIYTHDSVLITDAGAIALRMGKQLRRGEELVMARLLERLGVPMIGYVQHPAVAECGDMFWLDPRNLAIGLSFRTNREGAQQISAMLAPHGITVHSYDLPYFKGARSCLHLLSLVSLLDMDLAVAYPSLIPVALCREFELRGIKLIEVPEAEFLRGMATNVLALSPRRCLMLEGNPVTEARLREVGCEVLTYRGREISLKAEGGATCLTRPLLRTD